MRMSSVVRAQLQIARCTCILVELLFPPFEEKLPPLKIHQQWLLTQAGHASRNGNADLNPTSAAAWNETVNCPGLRNVDVGQGGNAGQAMQPVTKQSRRPWGVLKVTYCQCMTTFKLTQGSTRSCCLVAFCSRYQISAIHPSEQLCRQHSGTRHDVWDSILQQIIWHQLWI